MKKVLAILALSAIASMTWANVDLRTNIRDVYNRGTCEEAGAITMSVNGDDFAQASTAAPIYIRIRLTHGAKLCQTLVSPADDDYSRIFLAMRLEDGGAGDTILAHPDTVNIERWRAGEGELWLRVQSSSSTWVDYAASGPGAPQAGRSRVAWTFGVTARASFDNNNPRFLANQANRPSNERIDYPVSTLLCVDLSESWLGNAGSSAANPEETLLKFDTISWHHTNQTEPTIFSAAAVNAINLPPQFETNFSGDDSIARGYDQSCSGGLSPFKTGPVYSGLCIAGAHGNADAYGLVCIENQVEITANCEGWYGDIDQFNVYGRLNQAGVWLEKADPDAYWGFALHLTGSETLNDRLLGNIAGYPVYVGANRNYFSDDFSGYAGSADIMIGAAERGGYYLSSLVRVLWFGTAASGYGTPGMKTLTLHAEACQYYADPASDVNINVTIVTNNFAKPEDDAPYDGYDQHLHCYPSLQMIEAVWQFGGFTECEGNDVSIFFPYMPRLYDTDFWTGIAIVNHGARDFEAGGGLVGSIYEADGSNWSVEFPALPQKTMQTWLLTEGDSGLGFYGAASDPLTEGQFLQPETSGNDLVFGDTRMNMFVTGSFAANFTWELDLGDLDGYCLIGLGTSVDGAYLARNIAREGTQHQDLPVVIGKKDLKKDFSLDKLMNMTQIIK
ncbi:MAG: hypothetical protein CSA81_07625 [Acidobacteria bacterium]|nr:MAG: hypothetical protein CSA81_07625 [Acidobacteriota bacterium]